MLHNPLHTQDVQSNRTEPSVKWPNGFHAAVDPPKRQINSCPFALSFLDTKQCLRPCSCRHCLRLLVLLFPLSAKEIPSL